METDLRASLIGSGVAAVLSILVGLVAGVSALALLVRALVGGLAFGALVFGAIFLMRRFVPELFQGQAEDLPLSGSSVDIVLPGDLPEGSETLETEGEAGEGPTEAPSRPAPLRSRRGRPATDLVDEAEDLGYEAESLLDDSRVAEGPPAPQPLPAQEAGGGFDELDVLPDLESLSGGFSPLGNDAPAEAPQDFSEAPSPRPKAGGSSDSDPMVLAQAVRTLLKRDQER